MIAASTTSTMTKLDLVGASLWSLTSAFMFS
jgi:hypothetical protein